MSPPPQPRVPGSVAGKRFGGAGSLIDRTGISRFGGNTEIRGGRSARDEAIAELPHRNRELTLLIFAGLLSTAALATVAFAHNGTLTAAVFYDGLGFFALWGIAHLAVRWLAPAADPVLLPLSAALNGLGLVMIYRIDLEKADTAKLHHESAPRGAAPLQLMWTFIAIGAFIAVLWLVNDHRILARYSYTAGLAGLACLMLPALPHFGASINGARLWLRIGPFTFQPSEVSKILLMIFFAGYLVNKREVLALTSRTFLGLPLPRARDLGPVLVAWLASIAVLVVEKDLGSSLLFFGMFLVILYVATERASWLVIGLLLFVVGAFSANVMFAHVHERVSIWLHAFNGTNPANSSYQLVQGLYGFAAGGITGTGLGQGHPTTVPFANTDFIMASLGEELGLIGVMSILLMYALIVMRGLRAATGVRDPFGKLLATGLSFSLALQVFVQVGGVMRLIPLTGLTLPFLSYGGSSVVANAAIIALLLRISDASRHGNAQGPAAPLFDPSAVADSPTQVVRTT